MSYAAESATDPSRRYISVTVVALLHVAIIWALTSGLARHVVELLPVPIETRIIEEVIQPREAPPPPPPPVLEAPPPVFVPPPEINVFRPPPPPQQTITPTTTTPPPPAPAPVARTVAREAPVVLSSHCREPDYPSLSQRLGEEGEVMLALLVGVDGRVTDSRIERSSGYPRLDQAAVAGLSRCRFTPGTADGQPEQAWARLRYVFETRR